MTADYKIPTPQEIEAIQRNAEAMRAQVLADGVRSFARAISGLFHRSSNGAHA